MLRVLVTPLICWLFYNHVKQSLFINFMTLPAPWLCTQKGEMGNNKKDKHKKEDIKG